MKHPEEFTDTDPRVLEVWLSLQRQMSMGEKLLATLGASQFLLQLYEAGVRLDHPHASEREIFLRTAARHLDRDLMIRAYGWDPALHDQRESRTEETAQNREVGSPGATMHP